MTVTARQILDGLIALSDDKIWASELHLDGGTRRIDFWTLEPARSQGFRTIAYEIKVSRADYRRDSDDKQRLARFYSDRFWYVTPPSLLTRADIPEWAGLMEFDGADFAVKKRPPRLDRRDPDWQFVVSLMRNSGDSRRDVGLMKSQIAFLTVQAERERTLEKMRQNFGWNRLIARAGKAGAA